MVETGEADPIYGLFLWKIDFQNHKILLNWGTKNLHQVHGTTASLFVKKCFLARACEVFLLGPQNDNIPDDSNSDTLELGTPFHSKQKMYFGGARKPQF